VDVSEAVFDAIEKDAVRRMNGAVEALSKEFGGLRTGRASTSLLEPITVTAYGAQMPMNQVGTVGVPEPRMLTVQVWDRSLVKAVEKAILESGLGLNPSVDGQLVRVPIPVLSEERRVELTKIAGKYAEEARIAVRNVRRHAMDALKRAEKDGEISEDEHRDYSELIQEATDQHIKKIDELFGTKEAEIMQV
jgi:ribosome recycling factor